MSVERTSDASRADGTRRTVDKSLIEDVVYRYARGLDRRDWALLRSAFHEDAYNDHGDYKGDPDGFIEWISRRHATIPQSMTLLGHCLVEFFSNDVALAETYFASYRASAETSNVESAQSRPAASMRVSLGRYMDRMERRGGAWAIAQRLVVSEARYAMDIQQELRAAPFTWSTRDGEDPLTQARSLLIRRLGPPDAHGLTPGIKPVR